MPSKCIAAFVRITAEGLPKIKYRILLFLELIQVFTRKSLFSFTTAEILSHAMLVLVLFKKN
jgi:hypothetical protein